MSLKATKRRERKPETLRFLRRAWEGGLLELEIPAPWKGTRRRGYEFFAAALEYHADRLAWSCRHSQDQDYAVLQRVVWELQAARWDRELSESRRATYDAICEALRAFLVNHRPVL